VPSSGFSLERHPSIVSDLSILLRNWSDVSVRTSCTTFAIVLQLWFALRSVRAMSCEKDAARRHIQTYVLVVAPFFIFLTFCVVSVILGSPAAVVAETHTPIPHSNLAVPGVFFCIIVQNGDFSHTISSGLKILRAVYIFCSMIQLVTICMEAALVAIVYKQRHMLRNIVPNGWLVLFARLVLFSAYRSVALGLNLAVIMHPDEILLTGASKDRIFNGAIDFVQAAIPFVAFLIFSTERDIFNVWCFWRRPSATLVEELSSMSSSCDDPRDPRKPVKRKDSEIHSDSNNV